MRIFEHEFVIHRSSRGGFEICRRVDYMALNDKTYVTEAEAQLALKEYVQRVNQTEEDRIRVLREEKHHARRKHLTFYATQTVVCGVLMLVFGVMGYDAYSQLWDKPHAMWTPRDEFSLWPVLLSVIFGILTVVGAALFRETL